MELKAYLIVAVSLVRRLVALAGEDAVANCVHSLDFGPLELRAEEWINALMNFLEISPDMSEDYFQEIDYDGPCAEEGLFCVWRITNPPSVGNGWRVPSPLTGALLLAGMANLDLKDASVYANAFGIFVSEPTCKNKRVFEFCNWYDEEGEDDAAYIDMALTILTALSEIER